MRTNDPPAGFAACDKCEGTGMRNNGPETSGIGRPDWFEEWPCPSCQGSGLVPTAGSHAHERARRKAQQ